MLTGKEREGKTAAKIKNVARSYGRSLKISQSHAEGAGVQRETSTSVSHERGNAIRAGLLRGNGASVASRP